MYGRTDRRKDGQKESMTEGWMEERTDRKHTGWTEGGRKGGTYRKDRHRDRGKEEMTNG